MRQKFGSSRARDFYFSRRAKISSKHFQRGNNRTKRSNLRFGNPNLFPLDSEILPIRISRNDLIGHQVKLDISWIYSISTLATENWEGLQSKEVTWGHESPFSSYHNLQLVNLGSFDRQLFVFGLNIYSCSIILAPSYFKSKFSVKIISGKSRDKKRGVSDKNLAHRRTWRKLRNRFSRKSAVFTK